MRHLRTAPFHRLIEYEPVNGRGAILLLHRSDTQANRIFVIDWLRRNHPSGEYEWESRKLDIEAIRLKKIYMCPVSEPEWGYWKTCEKDHPLAVRSTEFWFEKEQLD
jgi:hypothetical protein